MGGKIIDAFLINDELDLLELRIATLSGVIDEFWACEYPFTFQTKRKPMHLAENQALFPDVRLVPLPDEIRIGPHPAIEIFQRRMLKEAWREADPDDYIMISDVDEIPDPRVLARVKADGESGPFVMVQKLYYYAVNREMPMPWAGPLIRKRGDGAFDAQNERHARANFPRVRGGWHFSWLGPVERIQQKLRDLECAREIELTSTGMGMTAPDPDDRDLIARRYDEGLDLFGRRGLKAKVVPIVPGITHPTTITDWLARHPEYAVSGETEPVRQGAGL